MAMDCNGRAISNYVLKQLGVIIPDDFRYGDFFYNSIVIALEKTNYCLSRIKTTSDKRFDYLVSWQYATFLYFLSRALWVEFGAGAEATRVFLLNKAVNGLDLYYEIELGNVFFLSHTSAIVFAKAIYGERCVFHQGCTIGRQGESRPVIEDGVVLYPGAQIIGRSHVRENTVISAGVSLVNCSTPGNCFVFGGKSGRPVFKDINEFYANKYFIERRDKI